MEGFEVPIHRALTQRILLAGVPREIAIINGTVTAAIVMGMHQWLGLPLGILLHLGAMLLAKKDEEFFSTYRRQIRQRRYYDV